MEERNFEGAGKVLAEIWNNMVVDEHEVTAEYIAMKPTEDITDFNVSAAYKSRHLIQTQYRTVALKCKDRECCSAPMPIIYKFFPCNSIPPLIPISNKKWLLIFGDMVALYKILFGATVALHKILFEATPRAG